MLSMSGMECEAWEGMLGCAEDLVRLPTLSRESSRVPMLLNFELSSCHAAPFDAPSEFAAVISMGEDKGFLPAAALPTAADAATHLTHLPVDHVSQTDVSQASSRVATPSPDAAEEDETLPAELVGGGERGIFGVPAFLTPSAKDAFRREPLGRLPLAAGALDAFDVDGALGSASRKRKGGGYDLNEVDDKTRRRLVKNRQSAEKSRQMRKVRMTYLEEQTSELSRALAAATARSELLERILHGQGLSDLIPTQ